MTTTRRWKRLRPALVAALLIALSAVRARAQSIERLSVSSTGVATDRDCFDEVISADGRIVAFDTDADNLVPGDTNGSDVFVRDRTAGTTTRVSVDSSGAQADGDSFLPAISADGSIVAFVSLADNLVAGDTNRNDDIFVHDRNLGTTERVSVDSSGHEANFGSFDPVLSGDGRLVAFDSQATNLVAGDGNRHADVFVHDRSTGSTVRVSVRSNGAEGNGNSYYPAISADGKFVAFVSDASNLVIFDFNQKADVFVHELATGITTRVSVDSGGAEGNDDSGSMSAEYLGVSISANGGLVAFGSNASNLVAGDTNAVSDVFLHDRIVGTTERVSVSESGAQANDWSLVPSLSSDGGVVAFRSLASDLVAGDDNGVFDIFVRDRIATTTEIMTRTCAGNLANGPSEDGGYAPSVSGDGVLVAYDSLATNLVAGDDNGHNDVFVTDRSFQVDDASWSNYGQGLAGTTGVPAFTSSADPAFGASITLQATNSLGNWTIGFLVIGSSSVALPFAGGLLLADPQFITAEVIPPAGWWQTVTVPRDDALCNVSLFAQVAEFDAGAIHGISLSEGLELHFGK